MTSIVTGLMIVAAGLAADGPGASKVRAEYEALVKEYEADSKAWEARFKPSEGAEKIDLVARYREWPAWEFAPRVLALAEANPDDPAAVDALLWIVRLGMNAGPPDRGLYPHYERALALLRGRLGDPRLDRDMYHMVGRAITPGAEEFLRVALDGGRDRDARGCACLALAENLAVRREFALAPWFDRAKDPFARSVVERLDPRFVLHVRSADPAALSDEAAGLYLRAEREFGDVVARRRGLFATTVGALAKGGLRELFSLSLGRIAPDIEGRDSSGERLSLRDHRGKVVVVAISHPGAVAIHRQLRDLLARHKGEPFAVLGVMIGLNKVDLDAAIKAGNITWPCWWDGLNGPICSDFKGRDIPPLFVLDADGVIRARGSRVDDLDEDVDRLLAERKGKP